MKIYEYSWIESATYRPHKLDNSVILIIMVSFV